MKRTSIAALLILVVWLSTGCNKGKDWVSPNGTKMYGDLTLQDGTRRLIRVEYPDGHTEFDITTLPDGSEKIRRIELPNGQKDFDVIRQNGFYKVVRREFRDGEKQFNVTHLPDGTQKIERSELPNGEKRFDVTLSADGVASVSAIRKNRPPEVRPLRNFRGSRNAGFVGPTQPSTQLVELACEQSKREPEDSAGHLGSFADSDHARSVHGRGPRRDDRRSRQTP